MIPATSLLRIARVFFPIFRPARSAAATCTRTFTALASSRNALRPRLKIGGAENGAKAVAEQVRGMKTRSSVKKMCEGCKVR